MIYPLKLQKGCKLGVTAPSNGCESIADINCLESGIRHFTERGYKVTETPDVRCSVKGRSADGSTRAKEFMQLITDSEVRAVFAVHGGDYLVEMLPYLDFDVIKANPKWVQGYSDTTGLTFTLTTNLDIATIYAGNFSSFGMEYWHSSLDDNVKILEGEDIIQHSFDRYQDGYIASVTGLEGYELQKEVKWRNLNPKALKAEEEIELTGRAVGGCLDVLLNLVGTRFDKTVEFIEKYKEDKILWYLESYNLGSEALINGLWQLKEAGWFKYASGFIFGRPAMYTTFSDTPYEEAVLSVLGELDLPIILDADIGHKPPRLVMLNGAVANVKSKDGKGSIIFEKRQGSLNEVS